MSTWPRPAFLSRRRPHNLRLDQDRNRSGTCPGDFPHSIKGDGNIAGSPGRGAGTSGGRALRQGRHPVSPHPRGISRPSPCASPVGHPGGADRAGGRGDGPDPPRHRRRARHRRFPRQSGAGRSRTEPAGARRPPLRQRRRPAAGGGGTALPTGRASAGSGTAGRSGGAVWRPADGGAAPRQHPPEPGAAARGAGAVRRGAGRFPRGAGAGAGACQGTAAARRHRAGTGAGGGPPWRPRAGR